MQDHAGIADNEHQVKLDRAAAMQAQWKDEEVATVLIDNLTKTRDGK